MAALLQDTYEIPPVRQGLAASEGQRMRAGINKGEAFFDFIQYPVVIDIP